MLQGNELLESGKTSQAMAAYEQARSLALDRFDDWPCSDDAVAAVVVSYLNLSEAQCHSGLVEDACMALCTVHGSLLRAKANPILHTSLREAAARHLRETYAALVRFQAQHGERPEIHRWLCADCYAQWCEDEARLADLSLPPAYLPGLGRPTLH